MDINRVGHSIRNKIISKSLAAFGFGQIQDAMNIISVMKNRGIDIDGFMEWGRYMQLPGTRSTHKHLSTEKTNSSYACPDCGLPLTILEVNTMPCNNIGGDFKTVLFCYDDLSCSYDMYSKEDMEYWKALSDKVGMDKIREKDSNTKETKKCGGCRKS